MRLSTILLVVLIVGHNQSEAKIFYSFADDNTSKCGILDVTGDLNDGKNIISMESGVSSLASSKCGMEEANVAIDFPASQQIAFQFTDNNGTLMLDRLVYDRNINTNDEPISISFKWVLGPIGQYYFCDSARTIPIGRTANNNLISLNVKSIKVQAFSLENVDSGSEFSKSGVTCSKKIVNDDDADSLNLSTTTRKTTTKSSTTTTTLPPATPVITAAKINTKPAVTNQEKVTAANVEAATTASTKPGNSTNSRRVIISDDQGNICIIIDTKLSISFKRKEIPFKIKLPSFITKSLFQGKCNETHISLDFTNERTENNEKENNNDEKKNEKEETEENHHYLVSSSQENPQKRIILPKVTSVRFDFARIFPSRTSVAQQNRVRRSLSVTSWIPDLSLENVSLSVFEFVEKTPGGKIIKQQKQFNDQGTEFGINMGKNFVCESMNPIPLSNPNSNWAPQISFENLKVKSFGPKSSSAAAATTTNTKLSKDEAEKQFESTKTGNVCAKNEPERKTDANHNLMIFLGVFGVLVFIGVIFAVFKKYNGSVHPKINRNDYIIIK